MSAASCSPLDAAPGGGGMTACTAPSGEVARERAHRAPWAREWWGLGGTTCRRRCAALPSPCAGGRARRGRAFGLGAYSGRTRSVPHVLPYSSAPWILRACRPQGGSGQRQVQFLCGSHYSEGLIPAQAAHDGAPSTCWTQVVRRLSADRPQAVCRKGEPLVRRYGHHECGQFHSGGARVPADADIEALCERRGAVGGERGRADCAVTASSVAGANGPRSRGRYTSAKPPGRPGGRRRAAAGALRR